MDLEIRPARQSHTHWLPLKASRKPKQAKECACPTREKKFSKMPHARLKKRTMKQTYKYGLHNLLTMWIKNKKNEKHDSPTFYKRNAG